MSSWFKPQSLFFLSLFWSMPGLAFPQQTDELELQLEHLCLAAQMRNTRSANGFHLRIQVFAAYPRQSSGGTELDYERVTLSSHSHVDLVQEGVEVATQVNPYSEPILNSMNRSSAGYRFDFSRAPVIRLARRDIERELSRLIPRRAPLLLPPLLAQAMDPARDGELPVVGIEIQVLDAAGAVVTNGRIALNEPNSRYARNLTEDFLQDNGMQNRIWPEIAPAPYTPGQARRYQARGSTHIGFPDFSNQCQGSDLMAFSLTFQGRPVTSEVPVAEEQMGPPSSL